MFCEKCGNPVEDTDEFCTNCGNRMKPEKTEEPIYTQEPFIAEEYRAVREAATLDDKTKSGKTKKAGKIAAVIAVIAVAAAVVTACCVAGAGSFRHFIRKTFSSPEDYYQWIEKQTAQKAAVTMGNYYQNYFLKRLQITDKSMSGEVALELGEAGRNLLAMAGAETDLTWVQDASIRWEISHKTGFAAADVSAVLNNNPLLNASGIFDIENATAYLQVPELNQTWLAFDENMLPSYDAEKYFEAIDRMQKVLEACPDRKKVEKIAVKYLEVAIECLDDVEKQTEIVEVADYRQKCTALEVTVNKRTMEKIAEEVIDTMEDDNDLKEMLEKVSEAAGDDAGFSYDYDDLVEKVRNELERALDSLDPNDKVIMTVYVDAKGVIRGRSMELKSDDKMTKMAVLMPQKGKNFGYEYTFKDDQTKIGIQGEGKRSKDRISGEFTLKVDGEKYVDIKIDDLDLASAQEGYMNGSFCICPSSSLIKRLGKTDAEAAMAQTLFSGLEIDVTSRMAQDDNMVKITMKMDGGEIGTFKASAKGGNGKIPELPSDSDVLKVSREIDLYGYVIGIDWNELADHLEKSNLPSGLTDRVRQIGGIFSMGGGLFY